MTFKNRLRLMLPKWAARAYRAARTFGEFSLDARDYILSTSWERGSRSRSKKMDARDCVDARTVLATHSLEKGGTLPSPRRPFGLARRRELQDLLSYCRHLGVSEDVVKNAESALVSHADFNRGGEISAIISPLGAPVIQDFGQKLVEEFFESRHSIRNFSQRNVDVDFIAEIGALAARTPSVCNRRSYRLHVYRERGEIDRLLSLQNGNSGFGHTVPCLAIVTERRSAFIGAGERNQRWIDGGLFSMSLVWAAHARGLGSCLLNWSQTNSQTDRLRKLSGISDSEDIIVMIALGYPAENYRVARSPLRNLSEVLCVHS